jgi:uncharacterized Zn finger protein (UPF0148 family)
VDLSQAQNKAKMAATAELIRRGASILQEACPRCGSVQIRYNGKVYCTNEDDLESLLNPDLRQVVAVPKVESSEPVKSTSPATDSLRKLMEEKLTELSKQLDSSTDPGEQARLLELISKYLDTLEKVKRASA